MHISPCAALRPAQKHQMQICMEILQKANKALPKNCDCLHWMLLLPSGRRAIFLPFALLHNGYAARFGSLFPVKIPTTTEWSGDGMCCPSHCCWPFYFPSTSEFEGRSQRPINAWVFFLVFFQRGGLWAWRRGMKWHTFKLHRIKARHVCPILKRGGLKTEEIFSMQSFWHGMHDITCHCHKYVTNNTEALL